MAPVATDAGPLMQWVPYCGAAPSPAEWLSRWNFDPLLLACFGLAAVAWQMRGGHGQRDNRAFAAAWLLLLTLFVSPLCALTSALFAARVTHHVLLTAVAAPLLSLALGKQRDRLPGSLAFWTILSGLTFWAWHSPRLYSSALSSDALYWFMQLSLLGTAVGFWLTIRRSSVPGAVAALLATMVQMGLLGALITFSATPLYAPHFSTTAVWGLAPLEDQQLAGLIMWAPSAGIYLAAALLLAHRWFAAEARVPAQ